MLKEGQDKLHRPWLSLLGRVGLTILLTSLFVVSEVVELVVEVLDEEELGAVSSGVSGVFFREGGVEVANVVFVFEFWFDWRFQLDLLEMREDEDKG